jgi:hypothetical protein
MLEVEVALIVPMQQVEMVEEMVMLSLEARLQAGQIRVAVAVEIPAFKQGHLAAQV